MAAASREVAFSGRPASRIETISRAVRRVDSSQGLEGSGSKAAGMTLEQIGVMLDAGAADRHRVLEDHIADLDRRMAEMQRSREMTEHALRCRAHDIATCPRFKEAVADIVAGGSRARWS